jgi:hypothetical protein
LNGCLDENGDRTEPDCGPINELEHWEDYRGVAAQRQCEDANCLCKKPLFNTTLSIASNAAEEYCNVYISSKGLGNDKWEAMANVLANFCAAALNPPKDWWIEVVGVPTFIMKRNITTTNVIPEDNKTSENATKPESSDGEMPS